MDLFEKWPGSKYADHARGNKELHAELKAIFATKTCAEWIAFADEHNTTIAPVNTPATIADDPQFADRLGFISQDALGADQLPFPVKVVGAAPPALTKAPELGQQTDDVLADVLGRSADEIAALRAAGTLG
jgi:crotonobetainyl-CoA:carnitine CoA-transferase CaiB-like acyl-CoA transferase